MTFDSKILKAIKKLRAVCVERFSKKRFVWYNVSEMTHVATHTSFVLTCVFLFISSQKRVRRKWEKRKKRLSCCTFREWCSIISLDNLVWI